MSYELDMTYKCGVVINVFLFWYSIVGIFVTCEGIPYKSYYLLFL